MAYFPEVAVLTWWIALGLCFAQALDDLFPTTALDVAQVQDVLSGDRVGEAARIYDATASSPVVDRDRRILAAARGVPVSELRVGEALRRYARLTLPLFREGQPDRVHTWFLAEHVGLPLAPWALGRFTASSEERAGELVRDLLEGIEPETPVAIATEPIDGGFVGIIVALDGAVRFEPFPRVVEPGATVRVPGTVLDRKESYALYVQREGTAVDEYPLEGEGAFDLEFAAPKTPGIYRVAMSSQQKNRLPDVPFFFSLYVGTEPPSGLALPSFGSDRNLDGEAIEAKIVEEMNTARADYDLGPLAVAGDPSAIRAMFENLPQREPAIARYLTRELRKDPLPGEPHGIWRPMLGQGSHTVAATVWAWSSNPRYRAVLFDPEFEQVVLGVTRHDDRAWDVAAVLVQGAENADLRELARADLAERWVKPGGPEPAPELEAQLDGLAAQIASGKRPPNAGKALKKVMKGGLLQGAITGGVIAVPPGTKPDVEAVQLNGQLGHLAIGSATGDLGQGKGVTYTVLLVVAATSAR